MIIIISLLSKEDITRYVAKAIFYNKIEPFIIVTKE